ncbi:hypothetical protein TNCV_3530641 [Trichonephila clavipes]|nr:hypothetical protein TNCV_3530641 [Trichonephila clavipes]
MRVLKEERFVLDKIRRFVPNECEFTPKRSSSRNVGSSSYRYYTATYSPASVSANLRTNDTIFVATRISKEFEDSCPLDKDDVIEFIIVNENKEVDNDEVESEVKPLTADSNLLQV